MQKLAPAEWKQVFELLDTALELPAEERTDWLNDLGSDAAPLKGALAELLAKHASKETDEFLKALPSLRTEARDATHVIDGAPRTGEQIGPYKLLHEIGRGGMGSVWLAERIDGTFKRKVALKLPHLTWLGGLSERMARERNLLATLEHPNIARLYDAGFDESGRPFMAMEYVEGRPIDVYSRERGLTLNQCLGLILQVARAVTHAHARLVVHRDLKPANILVGPDGTVRLLDFGIGKLLTGEGTDESSQTQFATRALTPDYASPEQIMGMPIGTASDIYSLGVVCYELLAGVKPYRLERQTAAALEEAIMEVDPPLASAAATAPERRKLLRGDLDAILNRALKKEPSDRYATVDAFAQDIERYFRGTPVQARPDSPAYRFAKFVRRHRAGALATVVAVIAVVGGASVAVWQAREARAQAQRSAIERDVARRAAAREEAVRLYLTRMFRASVADDGKGSGTTAKAMLDRSAQRVLKEYRDDPYMAGKVVETLADLYAALEDAEGQAPLLEGFLAQAGPEADPEALALVRQKLANVELVRGHVDKAATLLDPAEAFWAKDPQRYAEQLLEGLAVRGRLQRSQGDIQGSIATQERAIRARTLLSGLNHSETANLYNSLGISYTAANRLEDALKAYRQALAIQQALGHADDIDALIMRGNVGVLAFRVGRIAEAETALKGAYEGQRALSGDSAAVAASMGLYGVTQTLRGRTDEAIVTLRTAEQLAIKFAGIASPLCIQNRLFLTDALWAAGRRDEATALLAENLRRAQAQFGPNSIFAQRAQTIEARFARERGAPERAIAQLEPNIDALRKAGPIAQLQLAQALTVYGDALIALDRAGDAIAPLSEAVTIDEKLLWSDSWELAVARGHLGEALVRTRDPDGERLLARAALTLESQLGAEHPYTRRARSALSAR